MKNTSPWPPSKGERIPLNLSWRVPKHPEPSRKGELFFHSFIRLRYFIILFFGLIPSFLFPQLIVRADCDSAYTLPFNKYLKLATKSAVTGPGKTLEIQGNSKSNKQYFGEEHHTAWYRIEIKNDGLFIFNLIPLDRKDDYDLMLFMHTNGNFCEDILNKKIKPVRSNLARGDSLKGGITGLSAAGKENFVGQGKGIPFSKPLEVKAGQSLILVVDNVHSVKGHTLELGYLKNVFVSGNVKDDEGSPKKANIEITDHKGEMIYSGATKPNGEFSVGVNIWETTVNMLMIDADSSFYQTVMINTAIKDYSFKDIRAVLPKLKKGKKYNMGQLNFVGGMATLLPESFPNLKLLLRLLKKNPGLVIRIEGHINGSAEVSYGQTLSEQRATMVCEYLIRNGIAKDRLSTIGFAGTYMLYPHPANEWQAQQNRRVEINVLSVDGQTN